MLNGISLFSGYAGIDLALSEYVRPLLYCDIEKYTQGIMLSRMDDQSTPFAPIWNDVTTLDGTKFRGLVDVIYGGFPCQDISSAGKGAGLAGKRSGLFYEIIRISKESSPTFIFLENVAAIRTKGSIEIQEELASIGYDCRFGHLSASEIGAVHDRDRWFCLALRRNLANPDSELIRVKSRGGNGTNGQDSLLARNNGQERTSPDSNCDRSKQNLPLQTWNERKGLFPRGFSKERITSYSERIRAQIQAIGRFSAVELFRGSGENEEIFSRFWPTKSGICRANDVPPYRVDRIKALGNGVVPLQVKTAFETLMGII